MSHKVFPAARRAIIEIWHYTQRTWGDKQADKYVRGLSRTIDQAAADRTRWKSADFEGVSNVYFVKYERHFIFFRELSQRRLGVISILHDNMNIPIRLKIDAEKT
jgi:plasmid stabilization system protein ParE